MRYCFETCSTRRAIVMGSESRESSASSQRRSDPTVKNALDCTAMITTQTARRAVWRPLWELPRRYELILSLARRELLARYKGSVLGVLWALVTPIVMIAIFTFIFAGIF